MHSPGSRCTFERVDHLSRIVAEKTLGQRCVIRPIVGIAAGGPESGQVPGGLLAQSDEIDGLAPRCPFLSTPSCRHSADHARQHIGRVLPADEVIEGENLEVDPPRRLVQSFRALWGEDVKSQGTSRVTWEIEQVADSCRLTVTHDQLREDANAQLYGGWPMILSGIKTLLETGEMLTTPGLLRWLEGAKGNCQTLVDRNHDDPR
jgi:Activator of Hsp90 ATPase homolog 1-like protein